jgi:hypothetical protein
LKSICSVTGLAATERAQNFWKLFSTFLNGASLVGALHLCAPSIRPWLGFVLPKERTQRLLLVLVTTVPRWLLSRHLLLESLCLCNHVMPACHSHRPDRQTGSGIDPRSLEN